MKILSHDYPAPMSGWVSTFLDTFAAARITETPLAAEPFGASGQRIRIARVTA